MPKYTVVDGRKHLTFDNEEESAFYEGIFMLGDYSSPTPFDITNPEDLKKIGIYTTNPDTGDLSIYHPFPQDLDAYLLENEVMISVNPNTMEETFRILPRSKESKAELLKLKEENPALYERRKRDQMELVCEDILRKNMENFMTHPMVVYDQSLNEYPRELSGKKDNDSGEISFTFNDIETADEFYQKPVPPEKPVLPRHRTGYSIRSFFNRVTNGFLFKGVEQENKDFDKAMRAYDKGIKIYEAQFKIYTGKMKRLSDRIGLKDSVLSDYPGFSENAKRIGKVKSEKIMESSKKINNVRKNVSVVENNIVAVFGSKPEKLPQASKRVYQLVDGVDKSKVSEKPHGFKEKEVAVITHLAMFNDKTGKEMMEVGFQSLKGDQILDDRNAQLGTAMGHLYDVAFGRPGEVGTAYFTIDSPSGRGNFVSQAHMNAKEAYDLWNKENDIKPMAKLVSDSASILTRASCRGTSGTLNDSMYSAMVETDMLYQTLENHPELKKEVAKNLKASGESTVLKELAANHAVLETMEKSMDATQEIYKSKNLSDDRKKELLTDILMHEYMNTVLIQNSIANDQANNFMNTPEKAEMDLKIMEDHARKLQEIENDASLSKSDKETRKTLEDANYASELVKGTDYSGVMTSRNASMAKACKEYLELGDPEKFAEIRGRIEESKTMKEWMKMPMDKLSEKVSSVEHNMSDKEFTKISLDLVSKVKEDVKKENKGKENEKTLEEKRRPRAHTIG